MKPIGKLKIALVSSSFPPFSSGGVSSSHYNLFMLLKAIFEVRVFTFEDSGVVARDEKNILRFGLPGILNRFISFFTYLILRVSGSRGIIYQFSEVVSGALAGLCIFRNIKKYEPDIIVVPDHGAVSAFWPQHIKAKIIFISHHNSMRFCNEPLLGEHSIKDAEIAKYFEQRAISKADHVICPSQHMMDVFRRTYTSVVGITVIPNLIDAESSSKISPSQLHNQMNLSVDAPVIYIPSAGSVYKGSQFVFEIIRRISKGFAKEIGFYLSGNINAELMRCLESLPDNVRIFAPGVVRYDCNIANIKSCSLCVSPTIIESFGMALLEAQWNGLPVISFDVGGNRDVVVSGATGYLVPFPDMEELIDRSLELLLVPDKYREMSSASRNIMRQTFDPSLILDKYSRLFSTLVLS